MKRIFNESNSEIIVKARKINTGANELYRLPSGCDSPPDYEALSFVWVGANDAGEAVGYEWTLSEEGSVHVVDVIGTAASADKPPIAARGLGCKGPDGPKDNPPDRGDAKAWLAREGEVWVTVLGAGITGLSVAHELVERGFRVQVVEKSHGSPTDVPEEALGQKQSVNRYKRGLEMPDVGGIARTQWSTLPLGNRDDAQIDIDTRPRNARPVHSVHGGGAWLGAQHVGNQGDQAAKPPQESLSFAFGVPFNLKNEIVKETLTADINRWLDFIAKDNNRSIAALQIVMVVYRCDSESLAGLKPAMSRLGQLIDQIQHSDLQAKFDSVEAFPVARLDVDESIGATEPFVGLLIRHHEHLGLIPGEHGFRFFPGFYRHLRDTMKRTPIYDPAEKAFSARTVHDNLTEVEFQVIADPKGTFPAAFVRRPIGSVTALFEQYRNLVEDLNWKPADIMRFVLRLMRYTMSSSVRRASYYENISWASFLTLRRLDRPDGAGTLNYTQDFVDVLNHAPQALVAMDSRNSDARTQGNVSAQLAMDQFDLHENTDSALRGPTSEVWLQPWREYLVRQGVRFFVGEVVDMKIENDRINCQIVKEDTPLWHDGEEGVAKGIRHYFVCALDVVAAARVTRSVRKQQPTDDAFGVISDLGRLVPDPDETEQLPHMGKLSSDRFQTMTGLQFYYPNRVAFENGHVYFSRSLWGLSAISQLQFWGAFGINRQQSRLLGNLSVDIGAWRGVDRYDPNGCSRNELADRVQEQIDGAMKALKYSLPKPTHFHVDDYIQFALVGSKVLPRWNRAPFLINITGEWSKLRPIGEPWSPNARESRRRKPGDGEQFDYYWAPMQTVQDDDDEDNDEAEAPKPVNSGYLVHFDNLVFAGTYMRTFTRMTTMEAANESARHAVNAILDHLTYRSNPPQLAPGAPRRPSLPRDLPPRMQNQRFALPSTIKGGAQQLSTNYGDYCSIWDPEQNEFPDLDFFRRIDRFLVEEAVASERPAGPGGPAHLFDLLGVDEIADRVDSNVDVVKLLEAVDSAIRLIISAGSRIDLPNAMQLIEKARRLVIGFANS